MDEALGNIPQVKEALETEAVVGQTKVGDLAPVTEAPETGLQVVEELPETGPHPEEGRQE